MITRKPGKMPNKPLTCRPLIEVLEEKMATHKKGMIRKWLRCKIRQLSK